MFAHWQERKEFNKQEKDKLVSFQPNLSKINQKAKISIIFGNEFYIWSHFERFIFLSIQHL